MSIDAPMLLVLARGGFLAGLLSSFGVTLFAAFVLPPITHGESRAVARKLHAMLWLSLGLTVISGLAWLGLQTKAVAETHGLAETAASLPDMLLATRFGQVLVLQGIALAGVAACIAIGGRCGLMAAVLAGVAVLLEAGHSHAFAMGHRLLILSQLLHLLAAGAWLGGLLPLLAVVRHAPLDDAQLALRRFSPLAMACVAVLAGTALLQGAVLSGGFNGLFGTDYGRVLLLKTGLFMLLIALAANNRLRLTPALAGAPGEASRRALVRSIAVETALGVAVVLAAAALSGLEPAMHITSA